MLNRHLRHASSQIGTYLPVLLMACLALGSWWLLRNAPSQQEQTQATAAERADPDYFMRNFSVQAYNASGKLDHLLQADEMLHLPLDDSFQLTTPNFISIDEQGNQLTGHAKQGKTNSDGSIIELFKDAKIHRQSVTETPAMQFAGDHLRIFSKEKQVQSDQAVELKRGDDIFEGSSMRYDHLNGIATLNGPVRAHLPARGT